MAYLHISNLYKDTAILLFKECYALEKIHGTSAHVGWRADAGQLHLFSGEQQSGFEALFNAAELSAKLAALGGDITIYGECYGGKIQKQSHRYGAVLRFTAFDVRRNDRWLCVPEAAKLVDDLGLEFVHWVRASTDIEHLNALRDANSIQAQRCGITEPMTQEGVVLRPLIELQNWRGERVIAKHKRDDFRETFQPRRVGETREVLENADAIALEWVTPMRLQHVLQKLPQPHSPEHTSDVIGAMLEDVLREGAGELVDTRLARKAIATRAALLFKDYLKAELSSG